MLNRKHLAALLLGAACFAGRAAMAQEDCHCNCYFSFDCESGNFCNWGNLGVEDTCWWRTPKPEGNIGAGCDSDYGTWGRCDGKCTPSDGPDSVIGFESRSNLLAGIDRWAAAFNHASTNGGGVPSAAWLEKINAIEFNNPTVSYGLWRMVIEVMLLSRGIDYVIFPQQAEYAAEQVGVAAFNDDSVMQQNGDLAVLALLAEIEETGSGLRYIEQVDPSGLDPVLYGRICTSGTMLQCLYQRIYDMGQVLRGTGSGGGDGGGVVCGGCYGDTVPNDAVDVEDLLDLLALWGATNYPPADLNQDGIVDVIDLLDLLANWGDCAPPAP